MLRKFNLMPGRVSALAMGAVFGGVLFIGQGTAHAAGPSTATLEAEIRQLQSQIQQLQARQDFSQAQASQAQATANAAAAATKSTPAAAGGQVVTFNKANGLRLGNVNVKVGGYIAAEGVYRTKSMGADMDNRYTSIPLPGSAASREHELRGSARQTRLSLGISTKPDSVTTISGYVESDFMGAAPTSNSKQSNSYIPRLRQAWAGYERSDFGLHVFGGQMWSLATAEKKTLDPGSEAGPAVIDNSNVVGFTYARQPGFRLVKDFGPRWWAAVSVENPQGVGSSTIAGNGNLSGVTPTNETAPDVIAKVATDTSIGQFALFGLVNFFHNQTTGAPQHNNNLVGGGVGASAVTNVVPKYLDLQANVLWGEGTGRYGSANLSDVVVGGLNAAGNQSWGALRNLQAMVGLVGHPTPVLDVYGYAGTEYLYADGANGYGPGRAAAGGQVHHVDEGTVGFWWKFYQGQMGLMQTGLQYAYLRQSNFAAGAAGVTTGPAIHASDNTMMVSLRYYPFQ
ncbi:MAG TPA: hypothetical protein VL574_06980 [Stellaceae bacterium]|jgi:hypothetical protein|nr:hypothetical protein [Stellaceae bacterium]